MYVCSVQGLGKIPCVVCLLILGGSRGREECFVDTNVGLVKTLCVWVGVSFYLGLGGQGGGLKHRKYQGVSTDVTYVSQEAHLYF